MHRKIQTKKHCENPVGPAGSEKSKESRCQKRSGDFPSDSRFLLSLINVKLAKPSAFPEPVYKKT